MRKYKITVEVNEEILRANNPQFGDDQMSIEGLIYRQMEWLYNAGVSTVSIDEYAGAFAGIHLVGSAD